MELAAAYQRFNSRKAQVQVQ